jgi:hypothetical protein
MWPKADMTVHDSDVRFWGRADIHSGSGNVCTCPKNNVQNLVVNPTNDSRGIASYERIRWNVLSNYRRRSHDRILTNCYSTDDRCTDSDPNVSFDHDGLTDSNGPALGRFERMT